MNLPTWAASLPPADPDFILTETDCARICLLIYQRAGIFLNAQKRQMIYSRLSRRLRELGMRDFSVYLRLLEADPRSHEWELFTNALTTNLTAFFREPHHFPLLADHVRHSRQSRQPVNVWCSAASTGEEPYSIAMTLIETLGNHASSCSVVATDIDTQVLTKAVDGIFTLEQASKLSPERLKRFFLRGSGAQAGKVRIRPEVAAMVKFSQLNLLDPKWPLTGMFDAIFCRNVMIYFDKPTQEKILLRFVPLMKPSALLFAGHSENFSFVQQSLCLRGQTVYGLTHHQATTKGAA